ncbi:MAG: hypothetical protein MZV64_70825 [Ignavibacteriales bacterium]|nr:hypothetical protein [Ignavibacteriales bacterium]
MAGRRRHRPHRRASWPARWRRSWASASRWSTRPGASGAIGMQNAYDAPKDGYTWTGNADVSMVNYPVLDLMKVTHRDWIQWYALMTPNIIAVTADYPAKDARRIWCG